MNITSRSKFWELFKMSVIKKTLKLIKAKELADNQCVKEQFH
jgi:hypothetical protein